jgi:hypothetical protein
VIIADTHPSDVVGYTLRAPGKITESQEKNLVSDKNAKKESGIYA